MLTHIKRIDPTIIAQGGLDALYDVYAFGSSGDLGRGVAVASGALPGGIIAAQLAGRIVPKKYKGIAQVAGNFAGSVLGGKATEMLMGSGQTQDGY